jgi:hypothetical protein
MKVQTGITAGDYGLVIRAVRSELSGIYRPEPLISSIVGALRSGIC